MGRFFCKTSAVVEYLRLHILSSDPMHALGMASHANMPCDLLAKRALLFYDDHPDMGVALANFIDHFSADLAKGVLGKLVDKARADLVLVAMATYNKQHTPDSPDWYQLSLQDMNALVIGVAGGDKREQLEWVEVIFNDALMQYGKDGMSCVITAAAYLRNYFPDWQWVPTLTDVVERSQEDGVADESCDVVQNPPVQAVSS